MNWHTSSALVGMKGGLFPGGWIRQSVGDSGRDRGLDGGIDLRRHETAPEDPGSALADLGFEIHQGSSEEFVGYLVHLGRASVHSNTLPDRASRRGQIGE